MNEETITQPAEKTVSFRKLIKAMEKEGFHVCDIHLEEEHDPHLRQNNKFTGSVVIKTFPGEYGILIG
jgi:hypothetical protein